MPKSRAWGAGFPWLVHVLWARQGMGLGSSYAASAGRHLCVPVGTRCSPPAVRGGPVGRGVRGRALSPLRLPSSWGLSGPAAHVLWARVCGYGVQRCPRGPYSLCSSGAGSRGFAARVSVVRGVCGQALPLPLTVCPLGGLSGSVIHSCCGRGCAGVRARRCPLGLNCLWGPRSAGVVGAVPVRVARHCCEGRLVSGAVPPPVARPLGGLLGSATHMCGRGCAGVGARHCCLGLHALWELRAAGVVGGRARRGGLPPLRGVSGVRRCLPPCRPSSGAGGRGPATRVSRVQSVRAWGPSTGPTACALTGRRCLLWGWRKGVPGGGAFHRCEGRLRSGAPPPPTARPLGELLGSATHVLWARAWGCGGPTLSPWPARPVGAACRGGGGRPSRGGGGWPATVVRGIWCHALSLPQPPVLWGGQPGYRDPCVPAAVGAGLGTQHRFHSVRPCGPALLAGGVAEGRPRGGGLPPL